ncbi:MAG: Helix-turn-helix domain protein [Syntrophorhabdaceae bacterium PtaU1.Bin034]|nr:MAG: Helix-turn-helix domain protein [Syntrophorhabdaceae bacterium PtaU1.Bin034]
MEDKYLTETEVAELTRRAVQTLRNERCQGRGFPYVKIGKSVRYLRADVMASMAAHKIIPQRG